MKSDLFVIKTKRNVSQPQLKANGKRKQIEKQQEEDILIRSVCAKIVRFSFVFSTKNKKKHCDEFKLWQWTQKEKIFIKENNLN